ncbi:hypothetical protein IGI04_041842, partial [Brassica rapa subsp. trilocularis]
MPRTSPIASEPQHETKLPEATQLPFNQIGVPIEFVLVPAAGHGPETEEEEQEGKQEIAKELHHLISEPQHEIKLQEATKPASQQSVSLCLFQQQHTIRVMIRYFLKRDEERTRRRQTKDCELRT